MSKILKTILYVLLGISAVLVVLFSIPNSHGDFAIENLGVIMAGTNMVDGLLYWAYILLGIAICAVLLLSLINLFKDHKALKSFVVVLVITVVLIGVSYLLASGSPVKVNLEKAPTASTLKWTDTGLIITYILMGFALLSLLVGGVYNSIKKR